MQHLAFVSIAGDQCFGGIICCENIWQDLIVGRSLWFLVVTSKPWLQKQRLWYVQYDVVFPLAAISACISCHQLTEVSQL
jgi:polyferredoxin